MNQFQSNRVRRSRRAIALVACVAIATPAAAAPWTKILQGLQGGGEAASSSGARAPAARPAPTRDYNAPSSGQGAGKQGGGVEQAALAAEPAREERVLSQAMRPRAESGDPTSAASELRALMAAEDAAKATPNAAPAPVIPVVSLRALVVGSKGTAPSAIIRIGEGQSHIVREGREYPLSGGTAQQPASLLVKKITADTIEMEIRPTGQRMLLP